MPSKGLHKYIKEPMVLVLKEKHENSYFYIPDEETLHSVALAIVIQRHKAGYYEPYADKPQELDFDEEKIKTMPESLQKDARAKLQQFKNELRAWERSEDDTNFVRNIVLDKNGLNAYDVLRFRSNGEYEQVSLERLMKSSDYKL